MMKKMFASSPMVWKVFGVIAVALTLAMGFAYAVGQQVFRISANDPQVEIIEGVSDALVQGQDPQAFASLNPVDMAKSLSPFVIVYDEAGKPVSGTALLDGQTPAPPKAILDFAKSKGENRITWQPKTGVRIAVVIKPYTSGQTNGFVLAGKSLREVEARTRNLLKLTGLSWAIALVVNLLAANLLFGRKEEHHAEPHHPAA